MAVKFVHFLLITVIIMLVIVMLLRLLEKQLIFYPQRQHDDDPKSMGVHFEEVWLNTRDHERLHGYWIGEPKLANNVIFLHGNAGNISHRLDRLRVWKKLPLRFLLLDYRGFGKSSGSPSEKGIYIDAQEAYDYLTQQKQIKPEHILVFGESLGATAAIDLASKNKVAGVIIENGFTSLRDMAKEVFPWLPRFLVRNGFDTIRKIPKIRLPLLIVHGSNDEVVPLGLGQRLYEAANSPKEFYQVDGAQHNNLYSVAGDEYIQRIQKFLKAYDQ